MSKMDKTRLNKAVKDFIKKGDIETAKNFIIIFGSKIEDYNVQEGLKRIEPKPKRKVKDLKGIKEELEE
jgi:hypothetical protein